MAWSLNRGLGSIHLGVAEALNNPKTIELLATFFYLGRSPYMKGTVGTLGAIPLVFLFSFLGLYGYMAAVFAMALMGLAVCDAYEVQSYNHDSPEVVIDEVVGFLIAMTWLPLTWQTFVYVFIAFRVLDIFKPPPISWIDEKVRGGYGVMLDDIVAGLVVNLIFQFVYTQTNWLGVQWLPS